MKFKNFTSLLFVILSVCVMTFGLSLESYAQSTIKGKIVGVDGLGIPGATVTIKGTTRGTATDAAGAFSMTATDGQKLVVSYIGYITQEVAAKNGVIVTLKEDATALDEVVVIGYGTQKKETLTGAVTVVSEKALQGKGTLSSPLQALQGQVPGVIITRGSGAPGDESWGMSIRGAVSKNATPPLVIIDGIEYESINDLRLINSSDIESMNFLKDASAAIYGSKAAGGVVIVTTKKATAGTFKIDYNASVTAKVVGLQPSLMNIDEWSDGLITARRNDGKGDDDTWIRYARLAQAYKGGYIDLTTNANPIVGAFTDVADYVFHDVRWNDVMFDNAYSTQHDLSLSGGNDKMLYRLSLGYMYDGSTLQWGNHQNERYNFRLSNQFNVTKRFTIESVISYNRQDQVSPSLINRTLNGTVPQPGLPFETKDGKPYAWGGQYAQNWFAEMGGDNKLRVSAINISESLKYNLYKDNTSGLDLVANLGYNTSNATRNINENSIAWYSYKGDALSTFPTQAKSRYETSNASTDYYSVSGYLNYNKSFNRDHNFGAMLGVQYDMKEYSRTATQSEDIQSSMDVINGSGVISFPQNGIAKWQEAMMSYFTRLNYNYKSKYLLEANVRYDGSSKFRRENRWDLFYGFSAGWRLSEESFMKNATFIDELKLRASYGVVGNQSGIDRYDGIQLYNFNSNNGAYIGSGKISNITTKGIVTTAREWERIHNYNIGLDFGFLRNRLTGSAEIFMKQNNNMLVNVGYPAVLGDNAPSSNDGKFEAKGWEASIVWSDKVGELRYTVGGSFTYAENKLVDFGGTTVMKSGYSDFSQGYPLHSIFGLKYVGKIQTEEQLDKYVTKYAGTNGISMPGSLRLGDNMFEDVNKDGSLDFEDFVYLGSDDPKISYSFNVGLEWKNFDLSAVFQGVGLRTIFRNDPWRIPMRSSYLNTTNKAVGNTWSPDNRSAHYPTYSNENNFNDYNYQSSSWAVENGAYFRLKNLTLGYTIPSVILKKIKMSKLRVYFSGSDLWEISKIRDGWDPEAKRDVDGSAIGRFPFNRTYTVGLNITF